MSARDRISDLVGRYCDAVLRADAEAFGRLWTGDARWIMAGRPPLVGLGAITGAFEQARGGYDLCLQELLNGFVEPQATEGQWRARWQVRELQLAGGSGSQLLGVYHDLVVDGADTLRFAERRFELLYRGPADLSGRVFGQQRGEATDGAGSRG